MTSGRFVAYYRVSTARQDQSGLGLEAQRHAVHDHLNGGDWELIEEVTEVESGKKNDRPELLRAIELCQATNATLIIAKLDRLARNVSFISNLMEAGVEFVAVDMPQANRFTVHILAAVAEHEREMISQRTKDALRAAKARGVKLGTPDNLSDSAASHGRSLGRTEHIRKSSERRARLKKIIDKINSDGCLSLSQIATELERRKIPTARGGQSWQATQVARIIEFN